MIYETMSLLVVADFATPRLSYVAKNVCLGTDEIK